MLLLSKMLHKALYIGPLFVGIFTLVSALIILPKTAVKKQPTPPSIISKSTKLGPTVHQKKITTKDIPTPTRQNQIKPTGEKLQSPKPPKLTSTEPPKIALKTRVPKNKKTKLKPHKETAPEQTTTHKKNVQDGNRPFSQIISDVLSRQAVHAGKVGSLVSDGVPTSTQHIKTFAQSHHSTQFGFRVGQQGDHIDQALNKIILRTKKPLFLAMTNQWARDTGRAGQTAHRAQALGIKKSLETTTPILIAQLISPLAQATIPLSKSINFGQKTGGVFKITSSSKHLGHKFGHAGKKSKQVIDNQTTQLVMQVQSSLMGNAIGKAPKAIRAGIYKTQTGVRRLKQIHQGKKFGNIISNSAVSYITLGLAKIDDNTQKQAIKFIEKQKAQQAIDAQKKLKAQKPQETKLALLTPLNPKQLNKPTKNCAQRFYDDLQSLKSTRISHLRKQLKPIFQKDKKLPGKWVFSSYSSRKKSRCLKYKTYRSGKRKCIRWSKRVRPKITTAPLENEKKYLQNAHLMVRNQGRHPDLRPQAPNYWVINKIATDLNSYARQPYFPALCAGTDRMVNYFENNLGRTKKHIAYIDDLTALGAQLIEQRRQNLNQRLTMIDSNEITSPNNSLTKHQFTQSGTPPIKTRFQSNTDIMLSEKTINQDQKNQARRNKITLIGPLNPNDLKQALAQISKVLLSEKMAQTITASEGFIPALKLAKKHYNKHGTKQDMDRETRISMKKLLTLLEAHFYIQRSQQQLRVVSINMLGTLTDLKQAHKIQCQCQ